MVTFPGHPYTLSGANNTTQILTWLDGAGGAGRLPLERGRYTFHTTPYHCQVVSSGDILGGVRITRRSPRVAQGLDLIPASIYDRFSVRPSIRSMCTSCSFTITDMIQVCGNVRRARGVMIDTRTPRHTPAPAPHAIDHAPSNVKYTSSTLNADSDTRQVPSARRPAV